MGLGAGAKELWLLLLSIPREALLPTVRIVSPCWDWDAQNDGQLLSILKGAYQQWS